MLRSDGHLPDLPDPHCHRTTRESAYHMNTSQRIVLFVGAIVIGVMTLLSPWNYVYDYPGNRAYLNRPAYRAERFAGYYPLWQANTPTDPTYLASLFSIPADERSSLQYFSLRLNTTRLGVQLVAAVLISGILIILTTSRREH